MAAAKGGTRGERKELTLHSLGPGLLAKQRCGMSHKEHKGLSHFPGVLDRPKDTGFFPICKLIPDTSCPFLPQCSNSPCPLPARVGEWLGGGHGGGAGQQQVENHDQN